MKLKPWKLWGALAAAGVAVAVNFATEWKYNLPMWAALAALVLLTVWLESRAEQVGQHGTSIDQGKQDSAVLRWEERHGDAYRAVSTTSEKVATEFLKRVPPPLDSPHEIPSRNFTQP